MPVVPSEPYSLTPQPDFVPSVADSIPDAAFLFLLALIALRILWPRLKKAAGATIRKGLGGVALRERKSFSGP